MTPATQWTKRSGWVWITLAMLLGGVLWPTAAKAQGEQTPIKTRAVAQQTTVAAGGQVVIAVEIDLGEVFHAWPEKGVKLPFDDETLIRTSVGLAPTDQPYIRMDGVQYPATKLGKVPDPTGAVDAFNQPKKVDAPLYSGKAVSYVRLWVLPNAPAGPLTATIALTYQACDDSMCFAPEDVELPVQLTIVAAGAAASGGTPAGPGTGDLFAKFDAGAWSATAPPAATTPTAPGGAGSVGQAGAASAGGPAQGVKLFNIDFGRNIFVIFLIAAVGGMVLNLTPCVLPVIPLKIMSLTSHAKSRSHGIVLGLWMAAGVVAFWVAIGTPMAVVSSRLDPSQYLFGTWWVAMGIGLLVGVMGLGIMGLFNINLPQSVYLIETKADSPMGSFFYGVMAAVLGLPCFGFVAGGLLAAASTLPPMSIMAIFVGLGSGMAAPYLVLSAWPHLLKFIPRTGPASDLVKQVMGLLLLAAAAFFVSASIKTLLKEFPYLAGSMEWWAVGFFVAIAGVWMAVRTFQITRKPAFRVVFAILAVAMTAGIYLFAHETLVKDRATYVARQEAFKGMDVANGEVPAGVWLEYSPELFAAVQKAGRPIFLDFTADWCITCKALKAAILDTEPLATHFKQCGVVLMEVDCTVRRSPGSKKLAELGRTGVPTWAVFANGSDKPHFLPVDRPTSGTVLAELEAAGVRCLDDKASASSSGQR